MEQTETPPLFSRAQKIIVLVLACALVLGLVVTRHRRLASATPIVIAPGSPDSYSLRLDINAASWREIALLPAIGESKARAVVAEREKNGPFKSADDLRRVPGIGDKTIADLKPYVRAGQGGE